MQRQNDAQQRTNDFNLALRRNLRAVPCLRAGQRFMVIAPVLVPFFAHYGQDIQEIFLLESLYALTIVLMEVPSGYLADRFGRVVVLRVGGVLWAAAWLLLLAVEGFSGLAVFNVLAGLGGSLLSGADLALLYDSERLLAGDQPERPNRAVRNLFVIGMGAEGLASLSATLILFNGGIPAVVAAQALCGLLVLIAALFLREPARWQPELTAAQTPAHWGWAGQWRALQAALVALWQQSLFMRRLLVALCLWPTLTALAIWLVQRVWVELELTLMHFGWIWCLLQLLGAGTGHIAHDAERLLGARRTIEVIGVLATLGVLLLTVNQLTAALVGSMLLFVARGLFGVLFMDALNRRIDSDYRATINSLLGFGFRSSFLLVAPVLGWVFEAFGLRASVFSLATLAAMAGLILLAPLARSIDS